MEITQIPNAQSTSAESVQRSKNIALFLKIILYIVVPIVGVYGILDIDENASRMPLNMCLIISCFGIIDILRGKDATNNQIAQSSIKNLIIFVFQLFIFYYLIDILGFYMCAAMLSIFFYIFIDDSKNYKQKILFGLIFGYVIAICMYILLNFCLKIVLPRGMLM